MLQEAHGDVEGTLRTITTTAVGAVPGSEECSISYVVGRRTVETRAATAELPQRVDEMQNRIQEGPCLDAVWEQRTVRIDDMRSEERWPRFAAEAAELGGTQRAELPAVRRWGQPRRPQPLRLRAARLRRGVRGRRPGPRRPRRRRLAGAQHESHLKQAVRSRDTIGQAKGILMERHKLTADQAFQVLARVSQQTNRKLADIAEELTQTGAVPGAG